MPYSSLDTIYRSILFSKYFVKGWGKPANLKRLFEFRKLISNRELCYNLIPKDYSVSIDKDEVWSDYRVLEGHFRSPFDVHLPDIMPEEVRRAHFQVILPRKWQELDYKPVCLHLAGTGDHYFWKRRNFMCKPLLKEAGIGGIILESPFYGTRKPKDQVRSNLHNVSDIFVMGGCLMLESLVLFNWCEQQGLGPLGVTGLSMGGHMASLAATNWPKPLVLVPCLSWSTASGVFTQGVMSGAIPWDVLEYQYFSDDVYREEIRKMVTIIEDEAFQAGKHFIQNFENTINNKQTFETTPSPKDNKSTSSLKTSNGGTVHAMKSQSLQNCPLMAQDEAASGDKSVHALAKSFAAMSNSIDDEAVEQKTEKDKQKDELGKGILESLADSRLKMLTFKVKTSEDQSPDVKREIEDYQLRKDWALHKEFNTANFESERQKVVGRKLPFSLMGLPSSAARDREAIQFMRGIMDECTHLRNFSVPVDTSLIIAICATDDGYVPREGVTHLADVWPGAEVRYINTGHVGAYLLHQAAFRRAITDGFLRAKEKLKKTS